MSENLLDDYLLPKTLADQLGVSTRTLHRWNVLGYGPPKIKVGSRVLYHVEAVRQWLKDHERGPVRNR